MWARERVKIFSCRLDLNTGGLYSYLWISKTEVKTDDGDDLAMLQLQQQQQPTKLSTQDDDATDLSRGTNDRLPSLLHLYSGWIERRFCQLLNSIRSISSIRSSCEKDDGSITHCLLPLEETPLEETLSSSQQSSVNFLYVYIDIHLYHSTKSFHA